MGSNPTSSASTTSSFTEVHDDEDWAGIAAPGLAVVLDGLSAPDGTGTGCRHGAPWYVSQLGPRLLALASDPARSLVDALAEAIRQVAGLHPGCDLTHPGTPSVTMALLRVRDEGADTSPSLTPCCCSTPPTGSRWSAMSGSTSSRARARGRQPGTDRLGPQAPATCPAHPGTPAGT